MTRSDPAFQLFKEADAAWDAGDHARAFQLFQAAARLGDSGALNNLAHFYELGLGVEKDMAQALRCYKLAARRGDFGGMENMGIHHRQQHNMRQAKFWFKKAYAQVDDNGSAAYELGRIYARQKSRQSLQKAVRYFEEACQSRFISEAERESAERWLRRTRKRLDA